MLPADSTALRRARQGFANVIFHGAGNFAFGFEYHYLDREVRSGASGDNHRFMFVVMAGTARADRDESAESMMRGGAAMVPRGSPGTTYLRDL